MSTRPTAAAPSPLLRSRRGLVTGLLAACVAGAGWAAPAHAETVAELERQGLTRIIVKRDPNLSAAERADVRADADVDLVRRLALHDAELVEAAPGDLSEALSVLRDDPDVTYAEPDAPITGVGVDPWWSEQWGLENGGQLINGTLGSVDADVDALDAWKTSIGAGVTVAVIDSGLEADHPDLTGRAAVSAGESGAKATNGVDDDANGFVDDAGGWDWVGRSDAGGDGDVRTPEHEDNTPEDELGHGTHVAGIVAAVRDNSIGIAGIAPGARVLPLRVLDGDNQGVLSDAVEAFHYAGTAGVRVANASLGLSASRDSVRSLQEAIAAHPRTLYVVAAGNNGADNDAVPFYPCALPQANIVCVGASNNRDQRAWFSNRGRESVDLFAPGERVRSTYKGGYAVMDGTSMAVPMVAGTAALVAAAHPTLDASALKRRVLDGADPKASFAGQSVTGGRLNAAAAVRVASVVAPVEPPATPVVPVAPPPATPPAPPVPVASPPTPRVSPIVDSAPEPPAAREETSALVPSPGSHVATAAPAPEPTAPALRTSRAPTVVATPVLSALSLSSSSLRRSVVASFRLNRAAAVRLILSRKTCRGDQCRYKVVRSVTVPSEAGINRYRLHRSVSGRRLPAGSYQLSARAHNGRRRSGLRTAVLKVR